MFSISLWEPLGGAAVSAISPPGASGLHTHRLWLPEGALSLPAMDGRSSWADGQPPFQLRLSPGYRTITVRKLMQVGGRQGLCGQLPPHEPTLGPDTALHPAPGPLVTPTPAI